MLLLCLPPFLSPFSSASPSPFYTLPSPPSLYQSYLPCSVPFTSPYLCLSVPIPFMVPPSCKLSLTLSCPLHRSPDRENKANVLLRVSIAAIKYHHQKCNWGGKCLIQLALPYCCSPLKKSGQELKQSRILKPGADAEAMEGCGLLACFS